MMTSLTRPHTTTLSGFGEITQVAGVVPTVGVLRPDEAGRRGVADGHRFTPDLQHADRAVGQHAAVLGDDADLQALEHAAERNQPSGVAAGRGYRAVQHGQQVGVHLVDDHAAAGLRERHRHGGLGHAVGGQDGAGAQSERRSRVDEVLDVGGLDLLGARQGPAQRGEVELARRGLPAQPLGEEGVGEVGRRRHGALVLVDELGPQQGVAQEVHRRDLDQLRAEVHRHGEEARHAHVVEARQPADDDVGLRVDFRPDEHRLGVGHHIAVTDLDGLRRTGRTGCQLHQRDVVVVGVDGIRRRALQELLDGDHVQARAAAVAARRA